MIMHIVKLTVLCEDFLYGLSEASCFITYGVVITGPDEKIYCLHGNMSNKKLKFSSVFVLILTIYIV